MEISGFNSAVRRNGRWVVTNPGGWPADSPDLSWLDAGIFASLKDTARLNKNVVDVQSLRQAVEEAWAAFPQSIIDDLVVKYIGRLFDIKASQGWASPWIREVRRHRPRAYEDAVFNAPNTRANTAAIQAIKLQLQKNKN